MKVSELHKILKKPYVLRCTQANITIGCIHKRANNIIGCVRTWADNIIGCVHESKTIET
jgi:hypothetical protein